MNDPALNLLAPHLSNITEPTLWYADENTLPLCKSTPSNPLLSVITNRFDIFQQLQKRNIKVIFSDFVSEQYQLSQAPKKIFYRVSKEKSLVHFLINQAKNIVADEGSLIISGLKNEGIKTYGDKTTKILNARGKLKKHGAAYSGEYQLSKNEKKALEDQNYSEIQKIKAPALEHGFFYSKPGVFGWDKIDQGSELLLQSFSEAMKNQENKKEKTILDLGCGYGWLSLTIDKYGFKHITSTDNNAAALLCATKNATQMQTPTEIVASNCADTINHTFDIVLCNPPFHRGFQHHQDLTELFLKQTRNHLKPSGTAFFVVNSFIDIENTAKPFFKSVQTIKKDKSFKVLQLSN